VWNRDVPPSEPRRSTDEMTDRDDLDETLRAFLRSEPEEKRRFQRFLEQRFEALMSELGDVKANQDRNYLELKEEMRGVKARISALEDADRIATLARLPRPQIPTRSPSPVSIPPARIELDSGVFDGLTKEAAKVLIAGEATRVANAAIALHDQTGAAESWKALKTYLLKIAGGLTLVILSAVATSYGLAQCHAATAPAVLRSAP
jgi:hypothetical protein